MRGITAKVPPGCAYMTTVCMSEFHSYHDAESSGRGIRHGGGGRSLIHTDRNDHVRDIFRPHGESVRLMHPMRRAVHQRVGASPILIVGGIEIAAARCRIDIEIEL